MYQHEAGIAPNVSSEIVRHQRALYTPQRQAAELGRVAGSEINREFINIASTICYEEGGYNFLNGRMRELGGKELPNLRVAINLEGARQFLVRDEEEYLAAAYSVAEGYIRLKDIEGHPSGVYAVSKSVLIEPLGGMAMVQHDFSFTGLRGRRSGKHANLRDVSLGTNNDVEHAIDVMVRETGRYGMAA